MNTAEIRGLTVEEITRRAVDLKQELFNLRFQHEIGQLENPRRIRETKQEIARCLTLIREKAAGRQKPEA
jgi:large subunit ribosomal protein L29